MGESIVRSIGIEQMAKWREARGISKELKGKDGQEGGVELDSILPPLPCGMHVPFLRVLRAYIKTMTE